MISETAELRVLVSTPYAASAESRAMTMMSTPPAHETVDRLSVHHRFMG
jgi:hypothetical protein